MSMTFSKDQVIAAAEIVRTNGLAGTDIDGVFLARSGRRKFEYVTDRNGCTCPASGPCKHMCAVFMQVGDWK